VLWSERLEPELVGDKGSRGVEVLGHEAVRRHACQGIDPPFLG
jgi:hypothetical protein